MNSRHSIVLRSVLRVMRPLVQLLLRHGVTYPAFAAAMKRVFLDAAQDELAQRGMARTDSALTLLSGVHRRDVRQLSHSAAKANQTTEATDAAAAGPPLSVAGEVVARWMIDPAWHGADGSPRRLPKGLPKAPPRRADGASFDALVASVSSDVRPRAMLDELLRLGVASENDEGVALVANGFAPRQGLAEMSALFADNLGDHIAAASANLQGESNFLEQAIHVDQLTPQSVEALKKAAALAWKQAFKTVMREAQARFDADAANAPKAQRTQRARFGVYFFNDRDRS